MHATHRNHISTALRPIMSFILLGLLASGAWANPEGGGTATIHQLIENQSLTLDTATLFPGETIQAGSLLVEVGPSHGAVHVLAGDTLDYVPGLDYIGFDHLQVIATPVNGGRELRETLSIRVLPRALPVAGRFDGSPHAGFGAYDTLDRTMLLCTPAVFGSTPFTCALHDVIGASAGWLPFVSGDWDGDGVELPSLFDPTTGTLHHLILDSTPPAGTVADLTIAQSIVLPTTLWDWPAAGDWYGDGLIRPAFYDSASGAIQVLEDGPLGSVLATWAESLPTTTTDQFFWPVAWRLEATPRIPITVDGFGVTDPLLSGLWWKSQVAGKIRGGFESASGPFGRELPLSATWSAMQTPTWDVLLFDQIGGGTYSLERWTAAPPGTPGTVPVDFPNDPPGGS